MKAKLFAAGLLAAAATTLPAAQACAQDISFNVGAVSDYVFRGYSQSDEGPAVFGGADVTYGDFYGGVWASSLDFGDGTDAEVDFYAGWRPTFGAVSLDLGLIYYAYVGAPSGVDYDVLEFKAAASTAVGPATVGAGIYYAPDAADATGADEALYYEINAAMPITDTVSISGALGSQSFNDDLLGDADYATWNLGATWMVTDAIALDLRYHDTDVETPISDERVALLARYSF